MKHIVKFEIFGQKFQKNVECNDEHPEKIRQQLITDLATSLKVHSIETNKPKGNPLGNDFMNMMDTFIKGFKL